jgi:integrase
MTKRKRKTRVRRVPLSPELVEVIERQRERFRAKFGRDPKPGDPLFFDPHADTPQFMSPATQREINEKMVEAMRAAGIPPDLIYAAERTGLLVSEDNRHLLSKEDLAEWQAAIEEYHRLQRTGYFN